MGVETVLDDATAATSPCELIAQDAVDMFGLRSWLFDGRSAAKDSIDLRTAATECCFNGHMYRQLVPYVLDRLHKQRSRTWEELLTKGGVTFRGVNIVHAIEQRSVAQFTLQPEERIAMRTTDLVEQMLAYGVVAMIVLKVLEPLGKQ